MEFEHITGLLEALADVILPGVRKLRAERQAAKTPLSVMRENDALDQQLETALARLGSIDENIEFWQRLLTAIGATYTRPLFFESPQIREWLSNEEVKIDLRNLARDRLIGRPINDGTLSRIREKCKEMTGMGARKSTYAIVVVLAVLTCVRESRF